MARKNNSYTQQVKAGLVNEKTDNLCCRRSELAAMVHLRGFITLQDKKTSLTIIMDSSASLRYLFALLKEVVMTSPGVMYREEKSLSGTRYHLIVKDQAAINRIMSYLSVAKNNEEKQELPVPGVSPALIKSPCCCRSYLRGAFIAAGSINSPHADYHLEIFSDYEVYAKAMVEMMKGFDIKGGLRLRKNGYYVYIKRADSIMDFLRVIKAYNALLEMENKWVMKSLKGTTRRKLNFETANMDRSALASLQQLRSIEVIQKTVGIQNITPPLREAAELRLMHPGVSLKELGEMLEPPVSKPGMGNRFRRINRIARELGRKEEEKE